MKTKKEILEKIENLNIKEISWTISGINTQIPSAQAMIDALKWVLGETEK